MAEGKLVLGQQLVDTGPCTDNQQSNMGELANLLDALGNPAPVPGPGPIDPLTGDVITVEEGDTYDNVYVNEDGDLVYVDENGNVIIVPVSGTGTLADVKTFYNLVSGLITYPNYPVDTNQGLIDETIGSFGLRVNTIEDATTVHVPEGQTPNPAPNPAPAFDSIIVVNNTPRIRTASGETVYARYNHVAQEWVTDNLNNSVARLRALPDWVTGETQALLHEGNNTVHWVEMETATVVESIDPVIQIAPDGVNLRWTVNYRTKDITTVKDSTTTLATAEGTFGKTECPP